MTYPPRWEWSARELLAVVVASVLAWIVAGGLVASIVALVSFIARRGN